MVEIGQPRWWPAVGIAAFALITAGALLPGPPPPADAAPTAIAAYFSGNPKAALMGAYLSALGGTLWLWFAVAFYWVLRKTEVHAVWSLAYLSAAILAGAVAVVGLVPQIVLSQAYMKGAGPVLTQALYTWFTASGALASLSFALLNLSASVLIVRSGIVPRWIGTLGLLCAFLQFASASGVYIPSGAFAANGPVTIAALVVFMAWTVAIALALLRAPASETIPT